MSHILSSLLSPRENGLIFHLLGQDCSASACAVAQLYMATKTCKAKGQKSEWKIHSCGVVCLVQDRKLHSTFLRLFCVKQKSKLLWEQELYTPFKYSTPRPFFHTFPSDECWVGLNFADEEEAGRFNSAVEKSINSTKARPVFIRTHSLDTTSAWLLRDKLNASLARDSRSPSPKTPPPDDQKMTCSGLDTSATIKTIKSCSFPKTPSSTKAESTSLARKKGPLPPLPSTTATSSPGSTHNTKQSLADNFSVPLPPPYSAPTMKLYPAGVKKSASFAPGGNYSSTTLKHQRSFHKTAEMESHSEGEPGRDQ